MKTIELVDGEALKKTVLDHRQSPARTFFARLKDEDHLPFEITVRSKVLCGSKKHSHVSVVTAGVHKARLTRFPRAFACFRDRKRIHV